jgi:hypothetical protein
MLTLFVCNIYKIYIGLCFASVLFYI